MVDSDKANKSISKTEKNAKGLGGRFVDGVKTAGKWGLAIGGAAIAAGGAMFAMATKAGNAADRLLDLKAITGMSTDEIQRWEKVTKVAGVSADAMTNASQKLTKSLDTMANEGGKGSDALETLGLSFEEISNMDADSRMDAITKSLSEIEDPTERARIGTDLLGGSWKEIAPVVDMGAEAMEKAKASANIISEEDLNKANDFRITVAEMKDQAEFLFMSLALKVIPIMQSLMDWIQAHMPQIEAITSKAFEIISQVIDVAVDMFKTHLIPVFQSMKDWVVENLPVIQAFFETAFSYIQEIIQVFVNLALKWWSIFGDTLVKNAKTAFNTIVTVVQSIFGILRGLLDAFIGLFTGDWQRMGDGLKLIWENLWNGINAYLSGVWNILSTTFSNLWGHISGWFTGLKGDALQWGKNMIDGFVDGIKSMGTKVAQAAEDVVKKAGEFLKFWSPAKKGEGRFIVHWGRNMIDGFLDGVEDMIPEAQSTMNAVVGSMQPGSTSKNGSIINSNSSTRMEELLIDLIQAVKDGQVLNIDGKTFAKITGDYTDIEGGVRVRRSQRGLAT